MIDIKSAINGKKILVVGGTGTIGKAIVKNLINFNPSIIRVFDINEKELFELEEELKQHHNIRYLLGDVRDKERLRFAVRNIDVVFHTAALKHVKSSEYNPFEAIKTNILGLQNLIEVCIEENVEKVIFTSSDKATNPTSVMGATKLLGERLITSANYYKGDKKIKLSSVRFGNVVGSSGSVTSIFKNQILSGGPITVTDKEMTRFVMSIDDAVKLIFKTTTMTNGGEVFILKMPVLNVYDLANVMIEELSKNKIHVMETGIKPGEKKHEELMTLNESRKALETEDMFILLPEMEELLKNNNYGFKGAKKSAEKTYYSKDVKPMTNKEIKELLIKAKVL